MVMRMQWRSREVVRMGEVVMVSFLSLRCGFVFFSFTCRHNIFPPVAPLIKFSDVLLENEPLDKT
jgi:ABC-type thiamin/hydroxymethylpyrimidine transport system permease subunit